MLLMENTDQRGIGIMENGSEWSNGTAHFDRTGLTEKGGPPRKVDRCFRNFSSWAEPIHSVLDRNFRKFWFNGSCPGLVTFLLHTCLRENAQENRAKREIRSHSRKPNLPSFSVYREVLTT